jgi:hypothetical protein
MLSLLCVLGLLANACGGGSGPITPGVQPLAGKVIAKRGGRLQTDVERLLTGGYTPIGSHSYSAETFAAGATVGRKAGRAAGAHLVTLYEGLDPDELQTLRYPVTLSERGLSVTPGQVLKGLQQAPMLALFWARPDRSSAFGAYVFEDAAMEHPPGHPEEAGLRIAFIVRRSPALMGGLQQGDLVTAMDGEPLSGGAEEFLARLAASRGNLPTFRFFRDGEFQTAEVDVSP